MENFKQKINKYKIPYLDYKNIGWKQHIDSGAIGDVYNGILQDNTPVILKVYHLNCKNYRKYLNVLTIQKYIRKKYL